MRHTTRRTIATSSAPLCTALLLGGMTLVAAQQRADPQAPTFRVGTTLVEVSAIVTRDGQAVTDLTADDVTVFDNGVEQPLVAFEYVDLTTREGPAQRRDFVLVVDDWHISPELTPQTQQVADAFAAALGRHDRLGLVTTGPHPIAVPLSTDREAFGGAVDRLRGQQMRGPAAPFELELRTRGAFDVLRDVAGAFEADAAERRTIVLVSEGHMPLANGIGQSNDDPAILAMYQDVIRDAARANVAVYAIDPRGLIAPVPGGNVAQNGAMTMTAAMRGGHQQGPTMAARRFGSLGTISAHTGGTLTVDTNDLARDIPRIIRESRQYYRLAYAQPEVDAGKRQSRTRRIDVKVQRPGVQVRARQVYAPRMTG